ncbi:hypothetical protein OK016_16720 [Vibrio chagasii]|nr:hypothetical protein [Vibrio chagasii]
MHSLAEMNSVVEEMKQVLAHAPEHSTTDAIYYEGVKMFHEKV